MKIYLVQGEHPHVPGCPTSAFFTLAAAELAANELANIILKDEGALPIPADADRATREKALERASGEAMDDCRDSNFDVWITELDVLDAPKAEAAR